MVLQQSSSGQADRATAQDGHVTMRGRKGVLKSKVRGTPREGDPAAAMSIVVNDCLAAQLSDADVEAGSAERPQSDDVADHPLA